VIQKVSRLKNAGVFVDFGWSATLEEFKRFNLIYGWNRSGKTTLSRVFRALETKTLHDSLLASDFEVQHANGKIKKDEIAQSNLLVKVFNEDFVRENVFFDEADKTFNSVVYIGEEDVERIKKIKELAVKEEEEKGKFEAARTEAVAAVKAETDFREAVAKTVKTHLVSLGVNEKQSYHRGEVKKVIDDKGIDSFQKLTPEKQQELAAELTEKTKSSVSELTAPKFQKVFERKELKSLKELEEAIYTLFQETVVSKTIKRLQEDPDVNGWVNAGLQLVKLRKSDTCLFCEKKFEPDTISRLEGHFSREYSEFQSKLDTVKAIVDGVVSDLIFPNDLALYADLQKKMKEVQERASSLLANLLTWKGSLSGQILIKKAKPFEVLALSRTSPTFYEDLEVIVEEANGIIAEHNARVSGKDARRAENIEKLEGHLLADGIASEGYKGILEKMGKTKETETSRQNDFLAVQKEKAELEKASLNIGKAVDEMNVLISELFGGKELQIELDSVKKVYVLKRGTKLAKHLSQGERTAIAFCYFVIKIRERGLDGSKLLAFVDDPISSLDSGNIYHLFSLLQNYLGNVAQLFVSTHNFEFFNLMKEWLTNKSKADEKCGFYQVSNTGGGDKRVALLVPMNKSLKNFKSEYHFLFFLLNEFVKSEEPDLAEFYQIGNVARRFIEIYSGHAIPNTWDLRQKFNRLAEGKVSPVQRDKVYKVINDYSHAGKGTEGLELANKQEAKAAVKILLDVIKANDERHYDFLSTEVLPAPNPAAVAAAAHVPTIAAPAPPTAAATDDDIPF